MECRDMSMFTSTEKYSVIWLLCISFSSISMATSGLFSTRSGSLAGERPMWYTSLGSFSSSASSYTARERQRVFRNALGSGRYVVKMRSARRDEGVLIFIHSALHVRMWTAKNYNHWTPRQESRYYIWTLYNWLTNKDNVLKMYLCLIRLFPHWRHSLQTIGENFWLFSFSLCSFGIRCLVGLIFDIGPYK